MLDDAEGKVLNAAIRVNTIIIAVAMGLLCGAILWSSTAILLLRGGPDVGAHLSLLSVFFPGYSVSWSGAWIGLLWGFVYGALSGIVLYWSYARTLHERLCELLVDSPAASRILGRNCAADADAVPLARRAGFRADGGAGLLL